MIKATVNLTYRVARRLVIGLVGATVLILGIVMIVTPGPALVVIPAGLAILSLEFAWARHWLRKIREKISQQTANGRAQRAEQHRS